jgi:hypothetical protein
VSRQKKTYEITFPSGPLSTTTDDGRAWAIEALVEAAAQYIRANVRVTGEAADPSTDVEVVEGVDDDEDYRPPISRVKVMRR